MSTSKHKDRFVEKCIDEETFDEIAEEYPELEDLEGAEVAALMEWEGVGQVRAETLKTTAGEIREEEEAEDASKSNRSLSERKLFSRTPTRAELDESLRNQTADDDDREFVMIEQEVDKYYKKRFRVEVKETTCIDCGYDVLRANHIDDDYEELSSKDKKAVERTLQEHKLLYHATPSHKRVITKGQMKETNWTNPQSVR